MIFEDQNSGCCEKEHTSSGRMSISLNDAIAAGSFQFGAQSCRLSWMSQAGCEAGQSLNRLCLNSQPGHFQCARISRYHDFS